MYSAQATWKSDGVMHVDTPANNARAESGFKMRATGAATIPVPILTNSYADLVRLWQTVARPKSVPTGLGGSAVDASDNAGLGRAAQPPCLEPNGSAMPLSPTLSKESSAGLPRRASTVGEAARRRWDACKSARRRSSFAWRPELRQVPPEGWSKTPRACADLKANDSETSGRSAVKKVLSRAPLAVGRSCGFRLSVARRKADASGSADHLSPPLVIARSLSPPILSLDMFLICNIHML